MKRSHLIFLLGVTTVVSHVASFSTARSHSRWTEAVIDSSTSSSSSRKRNSHCSHGSLIRTTCNTESSFQRQPSRQYAVHHGQSADDGSVSDQVEASKKNMIHKSPVSRRSFWQQSTANMATASAAVLTYTSLQSPSPAHARGLVEFPCKKPMLNTYHLMRAGTTLLEEEDIWSTNPLFLTNRESALSPTGIAQVQDACQFLREHDVNPSVVKYSLAASAMDTIAIIRDELQVGQNRLIPEFTFMDPRAIGKWDMLSIAETKPAVIAMDAAEAGKDGTGARPPANDDGTPHETLAEQRVRLVQLMSIMETQFSGDTILLVFPDGSSPALLSAMMAGIPLNRAHEYEFQPAEVRLDVTMDSALAWLDNKDPAAQESYANLLAEGKDKLERLRSINAQDIVSMKDLKIEEERIAIDEVQRQQEERREAAAAAADQQRRTRQTELGDIRREQQEQQLTDLTEKTDSAGLSGIAVLGAVGGYFAVASASNKDSDAIPSSTARSAPPIDPSSTDLATETNNDNDNIIFDEEPTRSPLLTSDVVSMSPETMAIFDGLTATPDSRSSSMEDSWPKKSTVDPAVAARKAMDEYMDQDDGGGAWLQAMSAIIDEDDDDDIIEMENSSDEQGKLEKKINGSGDHFDGSKKNSETF